MSAEVKERGKNVNMEMKKLFGYQYHSNLLLGIIRVCTQYMKSVILKPGLMIGYCDRMESERVELLNSLVSEISKGMEQLKHLKHSSPSNSNSNSGVLEQMLSSHEEALLILTGRAPQEPCHSGISSLSDPPPSTGFPRR